MKLNSLSADAVTQPGGLYATANDALLKGLMAYFTNQDRERQATRQMKRDEMTMGRQQLADALAHAERYGVGPRQQDSGWLPPGSEQLLAGAMDQFGQRKAERDRAIRQRLLADIEAGTASPSQTNAAFFANGLADVPAGLQEEWDAQQRGEAARQAAAEQAAVKNELLMAQAALMAEKAAGGGAGGARRGAGGASGGGGALSSAELETLRERANRYADALGLTKYDYDEDGKPQNRHVNPDIPDAYRRVMELEAALMLPGAAELLQYDDAQRAKAPVAQPVRPAPPEKPALAPNDQNEVNAILSRRAARRAGGPAPPPAALPTEADMRAAVPFAYRGGMGSAYAGEQRRRSQAPYTAFTEEERAAAIQALQDRLQAQQDAALVGF
jgi:hypothetical protein